jgi:hypothetical protein
MSNVRIVKLKNGDELIATVNMDKNRHGGIVILKKPCILVPTAQNQIGIAPWAFMCKEAAEGDGIEIPESEVLYMGTPLDDLWNQYNSIFGSKLVVPDRNLTTSNEAGLKLTL